ncbi:hypothetical protein LHYA1_G003270 [Lachnellula hyalina]|uniref:Uncharacterized protein n=1 Tax=Lachnellula hyalina TaxID=1316788 RepID=A0A8H8R662_9HELO|nr:uncharacterized protein LHYA1_G003270 [Lachnellula hyalina]TVY28245.1 hypothetical protein LHYA1_G003270 [Lachnellula hyalina]
MANHRRSSSVSHMRLSQPLPPLPLPLLLSDLPAYRDDPEPSEEEGEEGAERVGANQAEALPSEPPEYQPMYDYLRAHQLRHPPLPEPHSVSDSLQVPIAPPRFEPYRDEPDEPFVVDIDTSQPPPSYNDLYREHEIEMQILERTLDAEGDPVESTEDICKWVVAMLLITLTVASVGTAFNWGRPHCNASMRC